MTAKQLKTWRIKHGYSQIELAEILGVTNQTIHRWENEKREIPVFLHLALMSIERRGRGSRKNFDTTKRWRGNRKIK